VLPKVDPLLRDARPAATRIRGLVHKAVPVADDLRPALKNLNAVTPHLSNAFSVLNYVVNELGYNPAGPEEGYLFWAAWFFHNADSILSIEDANGVAWRGGLIASCSTLSGLPTNAPALALLMPQLPVCPKDATR
jgi:phospholipid/cholesterol/gamma-HCH transport system substrate-binding protein